MADSKNEAAWKLLFERHQILKAIEKTGYYLITSTEINAIREARLMTKFDHQSQLPRLFAAHHLSILPVTRRNYLISSFNAFHPFEPDDDVTVHKIKFPSHIESLDFRNITSESTALNCAFITGIIQDFVNDDTLFATVNGRMSSSAFDFNVRCADGQTRNVAVKNAQIEIDAGYEGARSLSLIEAKNYIAGDFLIRQLYYPFRLWHGQINKPIRPLFLTYTNGIFQLREYVFEDFRTYNSLRLHRQKKYIIDEGEPPINLQTILDVLHRTSVVAEPNVPFPQADSFQRVINLCELLFDEKALSHQQITSNYDFDRRQTNYYSDAGRYLGLIDKTHEGGEPLFYLTDKGNALFQLDIKKRQLALVAAILAHAAFRSSFLSYIEEAEVPNKGKIVEIMKASHIYGVAAENTFRRRASTISHWINWIMGLIEA
ncbi:type II restriction enzyme [Parapedobacter koreensis]|uniref:Uncharacterized protein n=1 Tax=Parapedobacter koreensis TaxID=332977 RepID=A0A1H7Q571_9SPHI|nr:transcriptional regulator [Parapedobacter koreensis]SEL43230.1 hypothetical protein SAMN05421740_105190 [Parapedobacter koreensis]